LIYFSLGINCGWRTSVFGSGPMKLSQAYGTQSYRFLINCLNRYAFHAICLKGILYLK